MPATKLRVYSFVSILLGLMLSILLPACSLLQPKPLTATPTSSTVLTSVAQTVEARLKNPPPTDTPEPSATSTLEPTATLSPAITATVGSPLSTQPALTTTLQSTATQASIPSGPASDKAAFVADVTVPDGTPYSPGTPFTKTWRIKNAGNTTWTTDYTLIKVSADGFGGQTSVKFPKQVAPGETVDLSVDFTAPTTTGRHTSLWRFANAKGARFGVEGNSPIYVQVSVVTSETPQAAITPGSGGSIVTQAGLSVDKSEFSGTCPHTFVFLATFTLQQASSVTYQLEADSDVSGFSFNLPGQQTSSYPAGTFTLSFALDITNSGSGWVKLHITGPENVYSNAANFKLTCEK